MSSTRVSEEARKFGRPVDPAKRQAILVAATRSFFAHGYASTSIEAIAADAEVSKVTVYNHFGDKRALFAAAVEAEVGRMRGQFELPATSSHDLRARLVGIGEEMVAFLSRPEMVQFDRRVAAETERDPDIGAAFLEAGPRRMKAAFGAFLARMRDRGELVLDDPELAAEQFVAMCKGLGDVERRFGAPEDPAVNAQRIAGAVSVFLAAYAPR